MLNLPEQAGGALMPRRFAHFYQRIIIMEAIVSIDDTRSDP